MAILDKKPGDNGNAYSPSKILYNLINVKDVIETNKDNLEEAIDWEVEEDKRGGIIIMSTDVNALDFSENKFINFIKQKATTISNRINSTKKIDKIANKYNLVGWTIGHFLDGRYTAKNGANFGENSLSVELVGISSETLISIAEDLCREFNQEAVLVKDYSTGKIYFVNGE